MNRALKLLGSARWKLQRCTSVSHYITHVFGFNLENMAGGGGERSTLSAEFLQSPDNESLVQHDGYHSSGEVVKNCTLNN